MVIGGMPNSNGLRLVFSSLSKKKTIAEITRRFFDALLFGFSISCDIVALTNKGERVLRGDALYKFGIFIRFGAQLMIEMRDDKRIARLVQSTEQTKTICAARNADDDGERWGEGIHRSVCVVRIA